MSKLDGGELKRDYCAGLLSIQDVAKKHGIAKTTLIDMAKKYGWERKKKPSKTPTKKTDQNKNGRTVEPKASRSEKRMRSDQENSDTDLSIDPDDYGITLQQAWFAHWFVITKSRVEAYRRAGYRCEGKNAYFGASQVYRNIKVAKAIRDLEAKASKRYQADLDELVDQLVSIINADPRELSHFRRVNCRHCWGENFFTNGSILMSTTLLMLRQRQKTNLNLNMAVWGLLRTRILTLIAHAATARALGKLSLLMCGIFKAMRFSILLG